MQPLHEGTNWEDGPGKTNGNVCRLIFEDSCRYRSADATMGRLVRDLRRQERSDLRNRILSIHMDSQFVAELVATYRRAEGFYPVFANLRNGLWYGKDWDGACYFKSTDGHSRRWSFSYTRLNVNLAAAAAAAGGCIVVDSTRNGKRFPDSFTATVPIWCCVLNHLAEPEDQGKSASSGGTAVGDGGNSDPPSPGRSGQAWDTAFHAPRWLSASEASQIEERIPGWLGGLGVAGSALSRRLRKLLKKPLRPVWLSPESRLVEGMLPACPPGELSFTPVICVSASKVVTPERHREHHSWSYIQGAGDDEEHWACGLTPENLWEHSEHLVGLANGGDRVAFEDAIEKLLADIKTAQKLKLCEKGLGKDSNAGSGLPDRSDDEVSRASAAINEVGRHRQERWCNSDWHPGGPKINAVLGDTGLAVGSVAFAAERWACQGDKWSLLNLSDQPFPEDMVRCFARHDRRYLHIPLKAGKRANPPRYWKTNVFPAALEFIAAAVRGVQYRGRRHQATAIGDDIAGSVCTVSGPSISHPEDAVEAPGRKSEKVATTEGEGLSGTVKIASPGNMSQSIPEYALSGGDPGAHPLASAGTVGGSGIRIYGDPKGPVEESKSTSGTNCIETDGARAGGCLVVCPTGSEASVIICLAALIAFYPSRRTGNNRVSSAEAAEEAAAPAAEVLDASPENKEGSGIVDCDGDCQDTKARYLGGGKGGFTVLRRGGRNAVTKADVRWRFLLLQQEYPWARPPRRLMQELNEYFMTPGEHSWWTLSDRLLRLEVKPG